MINAEAAVPDELHAATFVATPLTTENAALDDDSYMASLDVVRAHSDGRWPMDGFSFADDLLLVAKHQADHQARRAFTLILLEPSRDEALGCLYVNPLREYLTGVGASPGLLASLPSSAAMGHLLAPPGPADDEAGCRGRGPDRRLAAERVADGDARLQNPALRGVVPDRARGAGPDSPILRPAR